MEERECPVIPNGPRFGGQKGVTDSRRAQVFTKLGREIAVAVRQGGPSLEENSVLRLAVGRARQANMPKDNIERAIERASGAGDAESWEEVRYEAYGPGGVAMLIDALTDNRNRTVAEVRAALTRAGGNMGETGSVAWQFEQRGVISVEVGDGVDSDAVVLEAIDAGAEDVQVADGLIDVITAPSDVEMVRDVLDGHAVTIDSAEVVMRPTATVAVNKDKGRTLMRLVETLEDLDDVQRVFTNADLPESILVEA